MSQTWWDADVDADDVERAPEPGPRPRPARPAGPAGTDPRWERAFEQAWPVVSNRLRAVLRARRVPQSDWDDYLQEVAARIITARLAFERPEDLLPWATTVLRRLHLDHVRRAERLQRVERRVSSGLARRTPDVASTVIAKLDLDRVADVVGTWSPFDREALLDGIGAARTRDSGASYVRRHRLRASLLRVIDGMGAAVAAVRRFHVRRAGEANQLASIATSPVALVCAALVLPFMNGPAPASAPPERVVELASAPSEWVADREGGSAAPAEPGRSPLAGAGVRHSAGPVEVAVPVDPPMRLPAEYMVTVEGGSHSGYVKVGENNEDPRPLWCSKGVPGLQDQCTDAPVPRVDLPVEEPW